MEDIILHPNESLVIEPGEALQPGGGGRLRIRFESGGGIGGGTPGENGYSNMEQIIWNGIKTASGRQTAVYKQGSLEISVHAVPEKPNPDALQFEDHKLYKTIRVFKIGKSELNGLLPKEGDTLTYNDVIYT
ncbi:MAG: hypothetical protein LBT46_02825, partial [Planctomycetaceae bacterium]|nr:hypothetical protein [Planctomycetaceae bacterium]